MSAAPSATLVDVLLHRSETHPSRLAFGYCVGDDPEVDRLTYGGLDEAARAIAVELSEHLEPGDRALMLYMPGPSFIPAFFGCLYAGVVPVPVYPPLPNRMDANLRRLEGIVRVAAPRCVLTSSATEPLADMVRDAREGFGRLQWLVTDRCRADAAAWRRPSVRAADVAFIQFTSGSTGSPRGVVLSHANLAANQRVIESATGCDASLRAVSWLPMYHDMGLIAGILAIVNVGGVAYLTSPLDFVQKPGRWLRMISRFRANFTGAPNFAYDLCAQRVTDGELEDLDLGCLRVAINGAEPVSAATIDRFTARFASCGFRREAFYPCYGLAESSLMVSGGRPEAAPVVKWLHRGELERGRVVEVPPEAPGSRAIVGSGRSQPDHGVVAVDPETEKECAPGEVGELWVFGPSVARGYWGSADASAASFVRASPTGEPRAYLRSGDLGFVDDGEIFVTGRSKDLMLIRGRNVYPADIEETAQELDVRLRRGGGAAFGIPDDEGGGDLVVLVQECRDMDEDDFGRLVRGIRAAVARAHDVSLEGVELVPPRSILRTSSGKIRRRAMRDAWLSGSLPVEHEWRTPRLSRALARVTGS